MNFYVLTKNGVIQDGAYRSLKALCDDYSIGYSVASRGRRAFILDNEDVCVIKEVSVVRMKKRGSSGFK